MDSWIPILCSGFIICWYHYFGAQTFPYFPSKSPFCTPHLSLNTSLKYNMFWAHLVLCLTQLWKLPFLQSPVPSGKEWYLETKIWAWGILTPVEVSLLVHALSGQKRGMCICIYTRCKYTHIHFASLFISGSINIQKWGSDWNERQRLRCFLEEKAESASRNRGGKWMTIAVGNPVKKVKRTE